MAKGFSLSSRIGAGVADLLKKAFVKPQPVPQASLLEQRSRAWIVENLKIQEFKLESENEKNITFILPQMADYLPPMATLFSRRLRCDAFYATGTITQAIWDLGRGRRCSLSAVKGGCLRLSLYQL